MKWLELSIKAPAEFVEPLSQIFQRYGHSGVVIEEEGGFDPDETDPPTEAASVTLRTYLPVGAAYKSRRQMIGLGIRLVSLIHPLGEPQEGVLEESEWEKAWRDHFTLLRIGQRTVIKPSWEDYSPRVDEVVIELDPGMAFGTGHHPTTRMCLEELEKLMRPGMAVLDVGTGSGILAIAAGKLGASSVLALEIDQMSAKVARRNVRANGVGKHVEVIQGTLPHPSVTPGTFSLVLANINARVIARGAPPLADAMAPGATLVASGIIAEHRDEAEGALEQAGPSLMGQRQEGDWITLVMGR